MDAQTMTARANPLQRSGTRFEWKIDCYDGCEHGCRYCYAWWIKRKPYNAWIKSTPIENVVCNLKSQLSRMRPTTKENIKDIFVSSLTDCYQPMETQHRITREAIQVLIDNDLPFTVVTKNRNVLKDVDLFRGYGKCRVGLTVVTLEPVAKLVPLSHTLSCRWRSINDLQ